MLDIQVYTIITITNTGYRLTLITYTYSIKQIDRYKQVEYATDCFTIKTILNDKSKYT